MNKQIMSTLIEDKKLLDAIEISIKDIMKDGKINVSDIPDIFNIVIECSENLGKFNLTYNELPEILNDLINYILNRYDLIPEEEEEEFQKMINIAIKLVILQPKIKKGCLKFWNKINFCKK